MKTTQHLKEGPPPRAISNSQKGKVYATDSARNQMFAAKLAYIKEHGAVFLFTNSPPPAAGWPRTKPAQVQR